MERNFYMASGRISPRRWLGYSELVHGRFGIHLAKIKEGWKPLFQQYPFIHSVADWETEYDDYECTIFDEYGQTYSWKNFIDLINEHQESGKTHIGQSESIDKDSPISYDLLYDIDDEGYEFIACSFC